MPRLSRSARVCAVPVASRRFRNARHRAARAAELVRVSADARYGLDVREFVLRNGPPAPTPAAVFQAVCCLKAGAAGDDAAGAGYVVWLAACDLGELTRLLLGYEFLRTPGRGGPSGVDFDTACRSAARFHLTAAHRGTRRVREARRRAHLAPAAPRHVGPRCSACRGRGGRPARRSRRKSSSRDDGGGCDSEGPAGRAKSRHISPDEKAVA